MELDARKVHYPSVTDREEKLRSGIGGVGKRPILRFQYAQDRPSKMPGGAFRTASFNPSSPM
jgi:hypothetical protein